MADEQSMQLLSFSFVSKTFAYKSLDQVSNRSFSAFTSVSREYLDPSGKSDWCAQYVDDIGVAVHTPSELTKNLDLVFKQIQKAGLETSIEKRQFDKFSTEVLGKTISTAGTTPIEEWITKFLENLKIPKGVKMLQRNLGLYTFTGSSFIELPINKFRSLYCYEKMFLSTHYINIRTRFLKFSIFCWMHQSYSWNCYYRTNN